MLEVEGFLTTEREQTRLYDGREWLTHYWHLKKSFIFKYSNSNGYSIDKSIMEKTEDITTPQNIYNTLSEDMWLMRKVSDRKTFL